MAEADGETLGGRIRKLRNERGLSLAQVAQGDFSRAFLNQVEHGKSRASTRTLRIIAARLETGIEYLLEGATPNLDREIALERARISLARGRARRCLAELEGLLEVPDWPFGTDARLCAAEALLEIGRTEEAERMLAAESAVIAARGDELRRERVGAMTGATTAERDPVALGVHLARLGDRAFQAGAGEMALERYRAARLLLEAAGGVIKKGGRARGGQVAQLGGGDEDRNRGGEADAASRARPATGTPAEAPAGARSPG